MCPCSTKMSKVPKPCRIHEMSDRKSQARKLFTDPSDRRVLNRKPYSQNGNMYCTLNIVIRNTVDSLFFIKIHGVERVMKIWYFIHRENDDIFSHFRKRARKNGFKEFREERET